MTAKDLEYLTEGERRYVRRLVRACLSRGYALSVSDGEEWVVKRSTDRDGVLAALGSTGEDLLLLRRPATGERVGSFWLIYGNDPEGSEVVANYTECAECEAVYREVFP